MTTLSKYEILRLAREAGAVFDPQWGIASNTGTATFERFATLCRAPLVAENAALKQAHEINADTLNAMQVEIDDWKARALKAEQAEVRLWDSQWVNVVNHDNCYAGWSKEDAINHAVKMTEQLIASNVDQNKLPSVATPPSAVPVVEPVAWNHGCNVLCASIDLWIDRCPHCGMPRPAAPAPQEPTSAVPVVRQMVEALERKLPGGKQTDDFESSRIGDYNQGWNDYRKAVKKMFKNINMNSSENSNPDAYLYSLEYGEKVVDTKVSIHQLNYPFGVAGADYLVRNDDGVSYVRQTKLYAALSRALAAGQKFIKENGK